MLLERSFRTIATAAKISSAVKLSLDFFCSAAHAFVGSALSGLVFGIVRDLELFFQTSGLMKVG